jgi:TPR repeat protein
MDVFALTDICTSCIAKRLDAIFAVVNSSEFNSDEAMDAFERKEYDRVVEMTLPHAIAGNSDAQTQLSLLYQLGLGVKRDVLEAERWLLKATEQNNPVAWNNLGTLYASQLPELRHHWNDAMECYQRAKELGLNVAEPYPPPLCSDPNA